MRKKLIIIISVLLLFSVILVFFPFKKKGVLWDANCDYQKYVPFSCNSLGSNWERMEFDRFFFEKQYAIYEGEYTVNIFGEIEPNGFGIYKDPIGRNYEGEWKDGKENGYGTFWSAIVKYEGEFKDGGKHGKGTQTWSSRTKVGKWDGKLSWVDGAEDGFVGTIFYSDGSKRVVEHKELIPQPYYRHSSDIPYISFVWNSLKIGNLARLFVNTFKGGKDIHSTRYDKDGNIIGKSVNSMQLKKLENGEWQESVRWSGSRLDVRGYDGQFYYFFPFLTFSITYF